MSEWIADVKKPQFLLSIVVLIGAAGFAWFQVQSHCESSAIHMTMPAMEEKFETKEIADQRYEHIREDLTEIKEDVRSIRRTVSRN